jgi:hypothetical protein
VEFYPRRGHISRHAVGQHIGCGLLNLCEQQLGLVRGKADVVMARQPNIERY